ncbi:CsbD family protein [Sphingomonas quercus]|uniref:CsbD family protein n=1 Tax=Sphingomonas quercus TaxID=2842451 RepID=A0ABS6BKV9_9SPHN|nr:CsbD family protein [Sphingomonas quercus]MBU3078947.1 CsbD family protein [Sphingomonas quercus]
MGELKDRVEGAANEAIGKAKRAIGDATDRPDIRAEGDAQEARGDVQSAIGRAKGGVKNAVDRI